MWRATWAGIPAMTRVMDTASEFDFDFFQSLMRELEHELVAYTKVTLMSRPGGGATVSEYVRGASEGGNNSYYGASAIMAGYELQAPYPDRDSGGGRQWFVEAGQASPDRTGRTYANRFPGTPFYDDTFSYGAMLFVEMIEDDVIRRVFAG